MFKGVFLSSFIFSAVAFADCRPSDPIHSPTLNTFTCTSDNGLIVGDSVIDSFQLDHEINKGIVIINCTDQLVYEPSKTDTPILTEKSNIRFNFKGTISTLISSEVSLSIGYWLKHGAGAGNAYLKLGIKSSEVKYDCRSNLSP